MSFDLKYAAEGRNEDREYSFSNTDQPRSVNNMLLRSSRRIGLRTVYSHCHYLDSHKQANKMFCVSFVFMKIKLRFNFTIAFTESTRRTAAKQQSFLNKITSILGSLEVQKYVRTDARVDKSDVISKPKFFALTHYRNFFPMVLHQLETPC